jgi:hypothetical protein
MLMTASPDRGATADPSSSMLNTSTAPAVSATGGGGSSSNGGGSSRGKSRQSQRRSSSLPRSRPYSTELRSEKNGLFSSFSFLLQNHRLTKTGSGQT